MKRIVTYLQVLIVVSILIVPSMPAIVPIARAITIVNANNFQGSDLGAKINAADASLGSQVGEIQVSGGGTISTRVVLSQNHTLRFSAGTYSFVNEPILMREHTQVIGSGWDTILVEPTGSRWFVIAAYNGTIAQGINGPKDEDLTIRDLQIKGANPGVDSAQSTIWLGNVHRAIVTNVWFNGTRANGISAGGWGIDGIYAEDVWLVNNKFTQVAAQEANGINVRRMTIANNLFERPGAADGPFQAVIDFEPNDAVDKIEEVAILNNTLDSRNSARCNSSNFIVYQPFSNHTTATGGPAIIAGNTMTGLADDKSCTYSSNGILITKASHDVQIFNNNLSGCGQNGLYIDGGTRISIYNNIITNCGTGGIEAVRIGAIDSNIFNNTITAPWDVANTQIKELAGASNNNYYNNGAGPYTLQSTSHQVSSAPTAPAILKASNPVIGVVSGQVTITSSTQYGEVHYTTDGSEPTLVSPLYTAPFASSATIKAKVFRAGQYDSDVVTQTGNGFTPTPPPPTPTPPPPAGSPLTCGAGKSTAVIGEDVTFYGDWLGATYTWTTPGATVVTKTGNWITLKYSAVGAKTVTASATWSDGTPGSAQCQVTILANQTPPPPAPNPPPASPSSLRLVNSNGTYYLIKNGQRNGITSPGLLWSYGFDFSDARTATSADLSLPLGELLLPGDGTLVKTSSDPTVWLITDGQKRGFTSQNVFLGLGFKFNSVLTVTAPELNKLPQGPLLDNASASHPSGVDVTDVGTIYWLFSGKRFPYPNLTVYNSWHRDNDFSFVVPVNAADKALPVGDAVTKRVFN